MLEQAPASALTHPLECVSPRNHVYAAGSPGRGLRGVAAHAGMALLAAVLALGSGCSLLLDFDEPARDAAPVIDAALDAGALDALPSDAAGTDGGGTDGGPSDAGGTGDGGAADAAPGNESSEGF